ncbi:DUF7310 family coiled-coil domain-containing protein [Halosimplex pelagicum]|uniref:DUF7310 domain-containing protein n=1 Tax=Halosimplex pelagicum TaxID=869886 RepID=A0A7D5PA32_9EURY|nr:hypothetical protein [Halosimplex pelagicum]QLH82604.1 hypothetical protein HZS54_13680 [Halosimplex pelagicum]
MSERDLDARLDAVERALTDGDTDLRELRDRSGVVDDLQTLEERLDTVESRLDELEAGLEAVRGYAGNVRAVNREVERRASAALAKAETVEAAVESDGTGRDRSEKRPRDPPQGPTDRTGPVDSADRTGPVDSPSDSSAGRTPERPSARATGTARTTETARANGTASADRDPAGPNDSDRRDGGRGHRRGRSNGPDAGGDGRTTHQRDRSTRGDGDRSRRDGSGKSPSESNSDSGTEQFIERVRDAL